jgi:hypothetical protein
MLIAREAPGLLFIEGSAGALLPLRQQGCQTPYPTYANSPGISAIKRETISRAAAAKSSET